MAKRFALIHKSRCVACGTCIFACPRNLITIHKGCYAIVDVEKCLGCGKCEKVCPAGCIVMKEREQNAQ